MSTRGVQAIPRWAMACGWRVRGCPPQAIEAHKATLRVLGLSIGAAYGHDSDLEIDEEEEMGAWLKDGFYRLEGALSIRPGGSAEVWEYGLTAGSFHDFTALRHLGIPVQALLGGLRRRVR